MFERTLHRVLTTIDRSFRARGKTVIIAIALVFSLATLQTTSRASAGESASTSAADLHVLPRPASIERTFRCVGPRPGAILSSLERSLDGDPGGIELVRERWRALGIVEDPQSSVYSGSGERELRARIEISSAPAGGERAVNERAVIESAVNERYAIDIDSRSVSMRSATSEGRFDALATLAQLPERVGGRWQMPCVRIVDAPALRWRILSDDVSRGPLPSMRYFRERIRTIASFKMNGYSPYMEHVFLDPKHPLPAPLDGITAAELGELARYAARFHVAFVPEQQTFAHMHETLKYERYAPLAELPHGYLLSPAASGSDAYARDLIADELAAVPHPPFFHIGSDEPSDLGRGLAKSLVADSGEGAVYTKHVVDTANFVIARGGGRPMIWDDALARHPELFGTVPKSLIFINWHYGSDPTYKPYIDRIAAGGFEQMVAPGALNWNEIYPDLDAALGNIDRFVTEGKAAHVLGLFQTVWHDDGETLFEATWYPVVYAAASAWETASVDRGRFASDFPQAFFGSDDARYALDLAHLARARTVLRGHNPREYGDYLFWSDVLAPDLLANGPREALSDAVLSELRVAAESALEHLRLAPLPPLHANAAAVMALAARRYDTLGREFQIGREARGYYDDARANADGKHDNFVYRGLFISKYLFWEQRDAMLALEPLVRTAWEYENRSSHEASVLERYRLAADIAIGRADRISTTVYRDYVAKKTLPTFDEALGLRP